MKPRLRHAFPLRSHYSRSKHLVFRTVTPEICCMLEVVVVQIHAEPLSKMHRCSVAGA